MTTYYHITFSPYKRLPVLTKDVAARLLEIVDEVAEELGFQVLAASVVPDHVHLVIEKPDQAELSRIMQIIKGRSARLIGQRWTDLTGDMGGHFWGRGYHYERHDGESLPRLLDYVKGQHEKHGTEPNWID